MTPAWLLDAAAAIMLVVAALSAARLTAVRLTAGRAWRRDLAHLLMAIAMAGMLAPSLHTLPDIAWAVIFGLLAAWFAVRVARDARTAGLRGAASAHCAPHLVHSCSMLYMFLAITTVGAGGTGGMAGMPGAAQSAGMTLRYPTLALAFAFVLVGYSIWDLDQISGRRHSLAATQASLAGVAAPAVAAAKFPVLEASGRPAASGGGVADNAGNGAAARGAADRAARGAFLLSPAVTIGCRIAMGITMAFMLFIAI